MHSTIYYDQSDLFPYKPISPIWMIVYSLSSFCFFTEVNRKIHLPNDDSKTNWLKQNTYLSFIHALICSVLLVIGALRAPEMFEDPLSHSNHYNYALLAFSIGYFLYDFVDCLQHSTTSVFPILTHHLIVVIFFGHALVRTRNIGYTLYGLSLEINSVFLHARRLLRWYPLTSISIYYENLLKIFVEVGNYVTFILLRFGVVIIGLREVYIYGHRVPLLFRLYATAIILAMGYFNLILFYRLMKNQLMGKSKRKRDKEPEDKVPMTNNHVLLPS